MSNCVHEGCQGAVSDGDYRCRTCERPLIISGSAKRYRITKQLGEGGMGVTYLAECREDGQVVIKIPKRGYEVERFLREAELGRVARQSHRIVHTLEDGQDANLGAHFIVQNHIPGAPLNEYLGRALSPLERLNIAHQLCEAVFELHLLDFVHRDLKPTNLMVGPDHQLVTIIDLGIGKHTYSETLTRGENPIFGTPVYAAPEIAGKNYEPSLRTDIYSVGVILYRLFYGPTAHKHDGFPYERGKLDSFARLYGHGHYLDAFELLHEMKTGTHRDLVFPDAAEEVRAALRPILKSCFHPKPNDRIDSGELRRQVRQVVEIHHDLDARNRIYAASDDLQLLAGLPELLAGGEARPLSRALLGERLAAVVTHLRRLNEADVELKKAGAEAAAVCRRIDELGQEVERGRVERADLATARAALIRELELSKEARATVAAENQEMKDRLAAHSDMLGKLEQSQAEVLSLRRQLEHLRDCIREPSLIYEIPATPELKGETEQFLVQILRLFHPAAERTAPAPQTVVVTDQNYQPTVLVDGEPSARLVPPGDALTLWRVLSPSKPPPRRAVRLLVYPGGSGLPFSLEVSVDTKNLAEFSIQFVSA